jgi:hypothetical protein
MSTGNKTLTVYVPRDGALPPNTLWENRFEIKSESSERIYVVAQNKQKRFWGCSCPAWRIHRHCKHLNVIGLRDPRLPAVDTVLTREFQGKAVSVTVLDAGFAYDGRVFGSLSAIAMVINGRKRNGFEFFGLAS